MQQTTGFCNKSGLCNKAISQMFDTRTFTWTATRVILGMALPPAVAGVTYWTIIFLIFIAGGIFKGNLDLTNFSFGGLGNMIVYSFGAAFNPSIIGSLIMETVGRLIFKTSDDYTRREKHIYALLGTALGGFVAGYVIILLNSGWGIDIRGAIFLVATGLLAGLLMSLLFLQLWKRELKPPVGFSIL